MESLCSSCLRYRDNDPSSDIIDANTGVALQKHADLWFLDGSVVIRAENTLFRIHLSQLARHSICFKDMLCISHSSGSSGDKLSNCPLLNLQDTAEDMCNFLTAMYDGPNFGNSEQDDFRVVSGILRLSTKYIVDSLRAKALQHLAKAWPTTLREWDAREDLARAYECETAFNPSEARAHLYPSPIDVIKLAREVDAPALLPSAFYDLSRYPSNQIFDPTEEESGNRISNQLSVYDMERLCIGKEAAQHTITSLINGLGHIQHVRQSQHLITHGRKTSGAVVCVSPANCRKDFLELVDLATQHYLFDRERGCCDPLYVAEELGQLKSPDLSECKACAILLECWAAREREKTWKMIPLWFKLDSPSNASPGGSPHPMSWPNSRPSSAAGP
ncbi:hypothetical protein FISHEDRAFT_34132 [Fistulina hepatica ATCC 64428]|uniref:BTB domain-containing protein n=1 Tax=Fistulina hepatica ATCC 64428 TaxID=1128425 RepID=A0A0D7AMP4_9AGAR|nr:hypothetical protein FISHEDRAFT_34132 [Fistulina hepatica ATCC 64428]